MRVFVTGATGFVGYNLVNRLVSENYEVRVLVRKIDDKKRFPNGVQVFVGDLSDVAVLHKALKGVDLVYNCAAALPNHSSENSIYINTNVTGVANLVSLSSIRKVKRFVHLSTVGVFGVNEGSIINENSKVNTNDIYSVTKAEGDKIVRNMSHALDLPFVIIRPTIAYGPYDTRPVFLRLFRLVRSHLFLGIGDGSNYLHTVYIDNLVDVLVSVAKNKKAVGEDFIVGDNPCPKFSEIVSIISNLERRKLYPLYLSKFLAYEVVGLLEKATELPISLRSIKFISESRKYNTQKAEKFLGYKPSVGLSEGLRRTYEWYLENHYL